MMIKQLCKQAQAFKGQTSKGILVFERGYMIE